MTAPNEPREPTPDPEDPRAPGESGADALDGGSGASAGWRCDLCGGPMLDRHCKLVCVHCGYQRDCSDP